MKRFIIAAILTTGMASYAADWPQWRGPDSNGIAPESPPLIDEFPQGGLKPLWESEALCAKEGGGWSSVSVAGGKAYVHIYETPVRVWRIVTSDALAAQGYSADMPAELSKKVEDARVSEERTSLGGERVHVAGWVDQWLKTNLPSEQSKYEDPIRARLRLGTKALPLPVLNKLATIADKKFETQDSFVKWMTDAGLETETQKSIYPMVPNRDVLEHLYCLDAQTGRTLWKTPFPGGSSHYPASSTPTFRDGKVYLLSSASVICCFDAPSGRLLWQSQPLGMKKVRQDLNFEKSVGTYNPFEQGHSSSVTISGDLAIVSTAVGVNAVALSDPEHKQLWLAPGNDTTSYGSAAIWFNGGKPHFIVELPRKLSMIEAADGTIRASADGGGNSTPAVVGDYAIACTHSVSGYKLAPEKVERLWTVPFQEEYASAVISDGYVYALGGGQHYPNSPVRNGKAICIELQSGKTKWEEQMPFAEMSSPILADGKIIAAMAPELAVFKASGEKFQLVGRCDLGLERWASPAISEGRVFLRTKTTVACYDLMKH
jgi:outer membrane protein assembly factor BamB